MPNNILFLFVALFFGATMIVYFFFYLFVRHIRRNYPDLYRDMGVPSLYISLKTNEYGWWPVFGFLLKRGYKNFEDSYFHRVSFLLSFFIAIQIIFFLLIMIVR